MWQELLKLSKAKQMQFAKQCGLPIPHAYEDIDAQITKELIIASTEELIGEALIHLPNRRLYRKDGEHFSDRIALTEELADAMLFIIAASIWAGTSEELLTIAIAKARHNLLREDHGRNFD